MCEDEDDEESNLLIVDFPQPLFPSKTVRVKFWYWGWVKYIYYLFYLILLVCFAIFYDKF